MKKVIFGISALVILAFVVMTTVNAQGDEKKDKKAKTEAAKDCSKCPSAAECGMANGEAPVPGSQVKHSGTNCDPAKCKDGKCDPAMHKDGKCNQECKESCTKTGPDTACTPASCHSGTVKK
jgi:Tfp pilus assembly protein PilX